MTRPEESEPVVITDKRTIDRGTSAPQPGAGGPADDAGPSDAPGEAAEAEAVDENAVLLAERTADLQRLQAEYANYRRRAERDRLAAGDIAVSRSLADFLPVLDDLSRAREHGDLTGVVKSVADKLDVVFEKLGLAAFGAPGDPFDPSVHEAVMHDERDDVAVPTCTSILRPGYTHRDRLLRAAMVGVSDPVTPVADGSDGSDGAEGSSGTATPDPSAAGSGARADDGE